MVDIKAIFCYNIFVMDVHFLELGIIIITVSVLAVLARFLKQPIILAYILTGVILGPSLFQIINNKEMMEGFAVIGIALLLFLVGLELDVRKLKSIGKVAVATGLGQILFTSFFGYLISVFLGFSQIASIYIAIALTFSSTIIILKLLAEKRDLNALYGKVAVGFLLVQDFVALLALIFLSGLASSNLSKVEAVYSLAIVFLKAVAIFIFIAILASTVIPKIFRYIAKSQELLFLTSIAWCFLLSILVQLLGLTIEIGAFLAGVSLASLPYSHEIVAKLRSLRDFFIILFFVLLGMQMNFSGEISLLAIAVFSIFVLIGNPFIVLVLMMILGFKKRTSFLASVTVAQISEFSLIVAAMGLKLGHISQEIVALIAAVGITTITASTYLINYSNQIYNWLQKYIKFPERKKCSEMEECFEYSSSTSGHVIVVGHRVMGKLIVDTLKNMKRKVLVVDFDPEVIQKLKNTSVPFLYGDIADEEIIENLNISNAEMIISTAPKIEDNLFLIKKVKSINKKIITIIAIEEVNDAMDLYKAGADYVIVPHILGGEHSSLLIKKIDKNRKELKNLKSNHIKDLKKKTILHSLL